ncbi:MAG: chromate transporter [Firmicutes bacterium]|nr:chromate transporter [Bacillota bacterium]
MGSSQIEPQEQGVRFLLDIFFTFCRVGAFTFGGGLAMLPLFEREVIEKKGWIKQEDILDIYAISQSLPGVIAVNASTFIGYRLAGVPGAVAAIAGVMTPSLLVIIAIASAFIHFRENYYVAKAFRGVRAAVAALIFLAAYRIGKATLKDAFNWILAVIAFLITFLSDIHVIYVILAGALVGIALSKLRTGGVSQ